MTEQWYQGDEGCDRVFHFAAESHVDRSIQDADAFVKTNVAGTYNLLEAAKEQSIDRFIHISTDEVYGSTLKGSFSEGIPCAVIPAPRQKPVQTSLLLHIIGLMISPWWSLGVRTILDLISIQKN